jgi:hypothetical protein
VYRCRRGLELKRVPRESHSVGSCGFRALKRSILAARQAKAGKRETAQAERTEQDEQNSRKEQRASLSRVARRNRGLFLHRSGFETLGKEERLPFCGKWACLPKHESLEPGW